MTGRTIIGVVRYAAGIIMMNTTDGGWCYISISHIMAGQTGFGAPVTRGCCAVGNCCVTVSVNADPLIVSTWGTAMTQSTIAVMNISKNACTGMADCTLCILAKISRMTAMGIWSLFDRMAGDTGYTAAVANSGRNQ